MIIYFCIKILCFCYMVISVLVYLILPSANDILLLFVSTMKQNRTNGEFYLKTRY